MNDGEYQVQGSQCSRGRNYAITELEDPRRLVTSTVIIENAAVPLLPIRTRESIPKEKVKDLMKIVSEITVTAPVTCGQVIVPNVLGTDTDLIASRSMAKTTA